MDCEIKERGACGHDGADGKFCSKELETIGDTPSNGTANQSHRGCRTEHDPEFFGPEPTFRKKGRQERRGSSERSEKCELEQHKSKQYATVDSHDLQGSSLEASQLTSMKQRTSFDVFMTKLKAVPIRRLGKRQCGIAQVAPRCRERIPSAAAQTRIVSKARIRLDSRNSVRSFKATICVDISEFESCMPSQAVRSPPADIRA